MNFWKQKMKLLVQSKDEEFDKIYMHFHRIFDNNNNK